MEGRAIGQEPLSNGPLLLGQAVSLDEVLFHLLQIHDGTVVPTKAGESVGQPERGIERRAVNRMLLRLLQFTHALLETAVLQGDQSLDHVRQAAKGLWLSAQSRQVWLSVLLFVLQEKEPGHLSVKIEH